MSLSVKTLQYRVTAGGDYRCVDSRCRCTDTIILPVEATNPMDLSALRTAIESHIVRNNRPETLQPFRVGVTLRVTDVGTLDNRLDDTVILDRHAAAKHMTRTLADIGPGIFVSVKAVWL